MRRPLAIALLGAALVLTVAFPAQAGGRGHADPKATHAAWNWLRPTVTRERLAPLQGIELERVCPFPVQMDERDGRVLTTVRDHRDRILSQHLTGGVEVVLTNTSNGVGLPFETGPTSILYHRDGSATVVQTGRSGIAYDQGRLSGRPSLTWFAGTVITHGYVDGRSFVIDVGRQRRYGLQDDICEMLVTGLKTRH